MHRCGCDHTTTPINDQPAAADAGTCRDESKRHCRLIRTGLGARVANLIGEAAMPVRAGRICVGRVVCGVHEERAVAINVDGGPGRSSPGEVDYLPSLHLGATRSERYARYRCRCRSRR